MIFANENENKFNCLSIKSFDTINFSLVAVIENFMIKFIKILDTNGMIVNKIQIKDEILQGEFN